MMELPFYLTRSNTTYFVYIDLKGNIVLANSFLQQQFTRKLIGSPAIDMAMPADRLKFTDALNQSMAAKNSKPVIIQSGLFNTKNILSSNTEWEFSSIQDGIVGIGHPLQTTALQEPARSNEKYESLFQQASDPILITDFTGRFIDANASMCKLFGYPKQELLQMNIAQLMDQEQLKRQPIRFDLLEKGQHVFSHRIMYHKNGTAIYVEANVKKFGSDMVMAIMRDLTQRRVIEANLEKSEKNLRHVLSSSAENFYMIDRNYHVTLINNAAERNLEKAWGKPVTLGVNILDMIPEETKEPIRKSFDKALSGEKVEYELNIALNDLPEWVLVSFFPVPNDDGTIIGAYVSTKDITEKKLLEQELSDQKVQEQKKIARIMIKAQEKERNHIGQELHDNVNQILAGTKIFLTNAGQKDEKVMSLIKYPLELIDSTIKEIRALSNRQVTPLRNIDLEELIQSLLNDLTRNLSIQTHFDYTVSDNFIDDDLKLNIYRIIQEQFNNIAKHAHAKQVTIAVKAVNPFINILVTDDGKGFDTGKKRKGIGISNMINRVESFNGHVSIESKPGNGSTVNIQIPYIS